MIAVLSGRRRIVISGALAVGVALRLAFALAYWVDKPLTNDEREYLQLAASLSAGQGFTYPGDGIADGSVQRFPRAPLYPLFLAGILRVAGVDVSSTAAALRAIKLTQCIVGALTIWVIGALARQAAGSTAAAIASLLAAIYPPLVWIPAYVLSETLYSFLALAAALLLGLVYDDTLRSRRLLATAGAGALTGLATLTRPATLLFAALIVLWSMFAFQRERVGIAVFLAMTLGVITPWTIRNFARYHRIVLIASEGGVTFWTGNHPLATGEGDMAANPEIKRADIEFRRRHPGLSAEELDAIYYRDALRFIASRPLWWIGLLARKMFYTVVPIGPSYRLHSPLYFVGSAVSYLLVFPFAVAGFIELRRRSNRRHGGAWLPPPRALVLLAISAVAACLIFFPQERFRIPVIDPTLIVGASAWIATRSVFEPAMDVARLNA